MKVALIGAPGSGKSRFAQVLLDNLPSKDENPKLDVIVDGYIKKFQDETNLAVAQFGTYIVNMQIVMYRLHRELVNRKLEPQHTITCGTLIDTSIYLAYNAAMLAANGGQQEVGDLRSLWTMNWFGMFRVDAWDYDYAFHLPLDDSLKDEANQLSIVFDDHVAEACETFKVEYSILDGSMDDKIKKALEIIEESNGSAVGGSGAQSETGRDQDSSVPDVRESS